MLIDPVAEPKHWAGKLLEIVGVMRAGATMVAAAVAVHPLPFVMVTV
jgi:hypothetical protein